MPEVEHEAFSVSGEVLLRSVVPVEGEPYVHSCSLAAFTAVAGAVADGRAHTGRAAALCESLPFTQAYVAWAFLKERGILVAGYGRRWLAPSPTAFEDALTEFHALAVGA